MYDAMGSDGSRGDMFPMAALLKAKAVRCDWTLKLG